MANLNLRRDIKGEQSQAFSKLTDGYFPQDTPKINGVNIGHITVGPMDSDRSVSENLWLLVAAFRLI